MLDWYKYQENFVNSTNTTNITEEPIYVDNARFSELIPNQKRRLIKDFATLKLYGDRISVNEGDGDETVFLFGELSGATVLGKNKLNLYTKKQTYQFKGDKSFCALKYVNLFYRYKNITGGDGNGKFLGL